MCFVTLKGFHYILFQIELLYTKKNIVVVDLRGFTKDFILLFRLFNESNNSIYFKQSIFSVNTLCLIFTPNLFKVAIF